MANLQSTYITGSLLASGSNVDFTSTSAISGSIFSGSFIGDGSGLTGTGGGGGSGIFALTGSTYNTTNDLEITGSITITGSFIPPGNKYNCIFIGNTAATGSSNDDNIAIGINALKDVSGGQTNLAIGNNALLAAQAADGNLVIGHGALDRMIGANSTSHNTIVGHHAAGDMTNNTDFEYNVYVGGRAGYVAEYGYNVGIGFDAMRASGAGSPSQSIAIGYEAFRYVGEAHNNIGIGYQVASASLVQGDGNIFIGTKVNAVGFGGSDTSNQLKIGQESIITISASLETGDINFISTASSPYFSSPAGNINPLTSSYAITASHALNSGGGGTLWTSSVSGISRLGDVTITGSVYVSASSTIDLVASDNIIFNIPDHNNSMEVGQNIKIKAATTVITGSLTVLNTGSSTTSSNVLSVEGSGSVSGSSLFEVIGSVGQVFAATDSITGSLMAVTDVSGIPILEVLSNNEVTANGFRGWRPYVTQSIHFTCSLSQSGYYFRCGGDITASIAPSSEIPFALGTEMEFYQTSSTGNTMITSSKPSVVINYDSAGGNTNNLSPFRGAMIKKVGTDEWDLLKYFN